MLEMHHRFHQRKGERERERETESVCARKERKRTNVYLCARARVSVGVLMQKEEVYLNVYSEVCVRRT